MANSADIDRLEALIRHLLADGIELNPDVQHTIDTTLSDVSPAELCAALKDPDSGDGEVLLDLIFFPDEDFQARIEPILRDTVLDESGEADLIQRFSLDPPRARILFNGGVDCLQLAMPEFIAGPFVARLHVRKRLDRNLTDTLSACLPHPVCLLSAVMLRNCRMVPNGGMAAFLSSLIRKWSEMLEAEDIPAYLESTLVLLEDLPENGDIRRYLMTRRAGFLAALEKAQRIAVQQGRNNMETLMMGGRPAAHIDIENTRRQVVMIEELIRLTR